MYNRNKIIAHVTFWIVSMSFQDFVWSMPFYKEGHLWVFIWDRILGHGSALLYFYINYFVLVPFFLAKGKYFQFGALTLLNVQAHILRCSFLWFGTFSWAFTYSNRLGPMTYGCLYLGIISTGFRMFELWDKSEENKNQLEKELKETEMLFLQSQMSPHFLFNTLNNLYGLSLNNSLQTGTSVKELKNLMHYFEHFEKGEKIQLGKELSYLHAFIEINRLRNPVIVKESIEVSEIQKTMFIEPMLLLPFIENAFKHGDLNKEIQISLSVIGNGLHFEVVNQITIGKRKDYTGGIGIRNIQRRLELLFPGKHQLNISNREGYYISQMSLEL